MLIPLTFLRLEVIEKPMIYDPRHGPAPLEWLAMDELERMDLVHAYHRKKGIRLPNAILHATFHVAVKDQIALGDQTPVKRKLADLIEDGLDRRDAIHAIGSVLAEHMHRLMTSERAE